MPKDAQLARCPSILMEIGRQWKGCWARTWQVAILNRRWIPPHMEAKAQHYKNSISSFPS